MWLLHPKIRRILKAMQDGADVVLLYPCRRMRFSVSAATSWAHPRHYPRFIELRVDRPRIAFSEVLAFDLNEESIHVVHQSPGYSNADAIVHFHVANLVYLGEVFPGDGYPAIDPTQGGTLDGLLKTLSGWTDDKFRVVPARGKVTTGATVKVYRDMIATVRDRVQKMINLGQDENQILAEHPTADFDATWGHGRTPSDAFVREVYDALKERR
jgi:cyclase